MPALAALRSAGWKVAAGGAVLALTALTATACSSGTTSAGSGTSTTPDGNNFNSATVKAGGNVTWTIEKVVDNWNPLTPDGNTFDYLQVLNPIYPVAYILNPDYTVSLNTDLLTSAEETSTNPQTIVYKIKPNAAWSDGHPITADDFKYAWEGQNGVNQQYQAASNTGYNQIKSVEGSDGGKTVTVVFSSPFSDWKSLFGPMLPFHLAASDPVGWWNNNFAKKPPTVSGGPFVLDHVTSDGVNIVLKKNPHYYGTPAKLDQVTFRSITDATQEAPALQNGEVNGIFPQPEIDIVNQIKQIPNVTYRINPGLQYEHIDLSLHNTFFGGPAAADQNNPEKLALRRAMFEAFNRQDLIAKTVGQFSPAKPLNSRVFVNGQNGFQDNVTNQGIGGGDVTKARSYLAAAGYTGDQPGQQLKNKAGQAIGPFLMRYTVGNAIRQNTCELFKAAMAQLGITINVQPTDSLGKTLVQADDQHRYDIVVFAWVNTPFPASASQPLFTTAQPGNPQSNYGYYSNPQVDKWLADAAANPDESARITALNNADQQISKDAYTLPLYQKPTLIAFQNKLGNVRNNGTQMGPTYNLSQWGFK